MEGLDGQVGRRSEFCDTRFLGAGVSAGASLLVSMFPVHDVVSLLLLKKSFVQLQSYGPAGQGPQRLRRGGVPGHTAADVSSDIAVACAFHHTSAPVCLRQAFFAVEALLFRVRCKFGWRQLPRATLSLTCCTCESQLFDQTTG